MIEFRAMLTKDLKFEGGFRLSRGTIIYAHETPSGWLGTYYEEKGSGHSFSLDADAFSVLQAGECEIEEIIVMPDPPVAADEITRNNELARRRLEHRISRHREQADELEKLLLTFNGESI